MAFKRIVIVRCPDCKSTNKSLITASFYHCNNCKANFYAEQARNVTKIVSNGHQVVKNNSKQRINYIKPLLIGVALFVIYNAVMYWFKYHNAQNDQLMQYIGKEVTSPNIENPSSNNANSIISTIHSEKQDAAPYPRTAYVLYRDTANQQIHLFRATFLTSNRDEDAKAVKIEKTKNKFIGYDVATGKSIPNLKEINVKELSLEAVILYSDKYNVILKNKTSNGMQLELIDPIQGKIVWTLSEKEIPMINDLQGVYSKESNQGIILKGEDFQINLPPNYYIISKKGHLDEFGSLDE